VFGSFYEPFAKAKLCSLRTTAGCVDGSKAEKNALHF